MARPAADLLAEGTFNYIELYTPPQTYIQTIDIWKNIPCPWIIHAPHFGHGVNLADSKCRQANVMALCDAQRFADRLHAPHIIVHGGFGGSLEETCQQVIALHDTRFILENTPQYGIDGQQCVGYTPEHISFAKKSGAFSGFVLDLGHAIYAANALKKEPLNFLRRFLKLSPYMLHISDGDWAGIKDVHHRIGQGNFNLYNICALLPKKARLTLEVPRDRGKRLEDSREDALALWQLLKNIA